MPTNVQDNEFASEMSGHFNVSNSALDAAIDWIKENLSPYEVFDEQQLLDWASGEDVEDVFTSEQLESWATSNGFKKEE